MLTFVKETRIPATPEEVWAFHERPDALELLTPPFDRIRIVRPPASLATGTEVVLKTRIGPFWKTIVAVHTASRRPEFFEDIMRRGPFAHWRHRHLFLPDPGGTLLRDEIEYLPPLGWLGRLVDPWLIRPRLERMFAHRHKVTRREVLAAARKVGG